MASEHSVSSHLRLETAEYDRIIRTFIPYYDESRQEQLKMLAAVLPAPNATVMDLGGGTGSLAESLLLSFPQVRVVVCDIDPAMLTEAKLRLERFAERVELKLVAFAAPLPKADAVLSAFALHHVPDLATKTEVYRNIRRSLLPGGIFLNNDAVAGPLWPQLRDEWAAFMATQGHTVQEAYDHLATWSHEDTYFSVREELAAMHAAGFAEPECFWRRGAISILGGKGD
jgi:tRNA (cmo5U34)-methyltransferase